MAGVLPPPDDGTVMRTTRLLAAGLLALGGLVAAFPALAQSGLYIGGSAGKSDIDDEIAIPYLITSGTVDGKSSGFKIFGGYQFSEYFGLDLAYVDLGKARYSGSYFGTPVTGGSVDVWGLNFSAVGTLPVGAGFAVFGKLGLFAWEATARDTTGNYPFRSTEYGGDFSLGVGFSYNFTKNISARMEWERFGLGGGGGYDYNIDLGRVDFLSLGMAYKF
jgi:OOP family OmpA-OmpF porin